MLKMVYDYNPDELYISTPGPVGLLGLLIGRMLGTEIKGIYHTDFTVEAESIIDEPAIGDMIEQYSKWFFNQFDSLLVPTTEYMHLLKERGYRHRHMALFRRGLRTEHFYPFERPANNSAERHRLLYVGRVSKDKNLAFLLEVYRAVRQRHPDICLSIAGDGPYLAELKMACRDLPEVAFLGRVDYKELPSVYNSHDLFVFPSLSDTFGMVVLEAQACGIPSLVSDVGGPKEIVVHAETGYVLPSDSVDAWVDQLSALLIDLESGGALYHALASAARQRVEQRFSWDSILQEMTRPDDTLLPRLTRHRHQPGLGGLLKLASNMMVHSYD